MKNNEKFIISLFFIAMLLFTTCASSSAATNTNCPVGEDSSEYNSMCLCDSDFTDTSSMDLESIKYFLQMGNGGAGSFLQGDENGNIYDVDGSQINPAQIIYQAAQDNKISPQVILNMLQKENSACTTPTRPSKYICSTIMNYGKPSTIEKQIEGAALQLGNDYYQSTPNGWQVGVPLCSQDKPPLLVTPASAAVASLYSYEPYVGADWGGSSTGNDLFCECWNMFGFGGGNCGLIIDDFENGLNWWSDNPWMDASLSNQSELGNYSMEIDVSAGADPEEVTYSAVPTQRYYDFWGWSFQYPNCIWENEIGQRLLNGPGKTITKITLYLCDFVSDCDYTVTLEPEIYKNVGPLPGQLFASGNDYVLSSSQLPSLYSGTYAPFTFNFKNGGVFLPNDGSIYNISVKALSFTSDGGPWGYPSPSMPVINTSSYFFGEEDSCGPLHYYSWPPYYGLAAQIYAKGGTVSRTFATPFDCSKYTKFKITAESTLPGNVLGFIYGTDKDHTVDVPITLSNGWQGIEVPISNTVDTTRLAYFAFELGPAGIDSTAGTSKQNTIYIDQIEAE